MPRSQINFLRNGKLVSLDKVGPNETLLDYLRLREARKGTKEGCNEGDCGACTVALGRIRNGELVYEPVNACIQLLGMIDGKDLVTVDDLASDGKLHPVQQAMVDEHGSQCGFCTPGFVMSLFTLYHSGKRPDRTAVNDWLAGNLCRCTGYRPIADAAFASIKGEADDFLSRRKTETLSALKVLADNRDDLLIGNEDSFFAAPASVGSLAELYKAHTDATIVGGATDVGLWITKQLRDLPKIIHTGRAAGIADVISDGSGVTIGAAATYADAWDALCQIDPDIREVLRRLGSKQVRASGTVGGNIANGSPIGDMPPMLIALGATLHLRHGGRERQVPLEEFFLDYGKQDREAGEIVTAVQVPSLRAHQHFRAYKISKRFDQDISSVLAAFCFTVEDGAVTQACIAFGGMAATPKRASKSEQAAIGLRLDDQAAWAKAASVLENDFAPITDMRASAAYRIQVAQNLFIKALDEIAVSSTRSTRVAGWRETAEATS